MLGKWHLGHFSAPYLPTARGFDSFNGYVSGETFYFSKKNTDYPEITDFMIANTSCYGAYSGSDKHDYSTDIYTSRAIEIIDQYKDSETPLFLYLAYQGVHDPYGEAGGKLPFGLPDDMVKDSVLKKIKEGTSSTLRREYLKSLYLIDQSIGQVYTRLKKNDMSHNTYFIFMSDNGGCGYSGGFNGPLRGSKASLFEGGVRTGAFITSPLLGLDSTVEYSGLFHISDWFPSILSLINIDYSSYSLDGVDQTSDWKSSKAGSPRTDMLYNMYIDVNTYNFEVGTNATLAIRNSRYKLMHSYNTSDYTSTYDIMDASLSVDMINTSNRCAQKFSFSGEFRVIRNDFYRIILF